MDIRIDHIRTDAHAELPDNEDAQTISQNSKRNQFIERHRNVRIHFTPTYSSWLNQVEIWFSKPLAYGWCQVRLPTSILQGNTDQKGTIHVRSLIPEDRKGQRVIINDWTAMNGRSVYSVWQAGFKLMLTGGGRFTIDNRLLSTHPKFASQKWFPWLASGELALADSRLQLVAVIGAVALTGLTLLTNQHFHGGVWRKLHNLSVRPRVTIGSPVINNNTLG